MARLDRVKNLTGLVECYGKSTKLREMVNLVVVGGYMDAKNSRDREEMEEIEKMHDLIKEYNLNGQFRWIAAQMNRARNGELYRYIADTRGVFVQVCDVDIYVMLYNGDKIPHLTYPLICCSLLFMKLLASLLWKP